MTTTSRPALRNLSSTSSAGRNYLKCYSAGYFEEQKGIFFGQRVGFFVKVFVSDMLGVCIHIFVKNELP